MKIFKQLNKKGYKHYYEGIIEELDSMDKDNQHLHSEIMQVIIWLYKKYGIWIVLFYELNIKNHKKEWFWIAIKDGEEIAYQYKDSNSPTEVYEAAIEFTLKNLI